LTKINHGEEYLFSPTITDPDGDNLIFSIANKPWWASFDQSTGVLSGTPEIGAVGFYSDIVISVSDGKESVALPKFQIEVLNRAPVIGNGLWLAAGRDGIYSSRNLATWKLSQSGGNGFSLPKLAWNGSQFIMVQQGSMVFASDDGESWQQYAIDSDSSLRDVIGHDGKFVAAGKNPIPNAQTNNPTFYNVASISTDGSSWTTTSIDTGGDGLFIGFYPQGISAVATDGVKYVALGNDRNIIKAYTSIDGLSWQVSATDIRRSININDMLWDGERFIAVGDNLVITSSNGKNWRVLSEPTAPIQSIAWNGERYMAVGDQRIPGIPGISPYINNAVILSSENAIDWERMVLPTEQVCIGKLTLVGQPQSFICDHQTIPAGLHTVEWDGRQFVAMGVQDVVRSVDGIEIELASEEKLININHLIALPAVSSYSVTVGENFSLSPFASDADGDVLTYSVSGLPAWASFDKNTGALSGSPSAQDIGVTSYVTISVTDGIDTVALPVIQIDVVPGS
jgi:hypothetical protein